MLRAVRFAVKLGFRMPEDTQTLLPGLAHLLEDIPPARLFEETLKLFHGGYAVEGFEALRHHGLFAYLFPAADEGLQEEEEHFPRMLIVRALENTDSRVQEGKPVTPAFLFAAFLWEPMRRVAAGHREAGMSEAQAHQLAGEQVMREQSRTVSIPRRFSRVTQEIWTLQARLHQTRGKRPLVLWQHPRFRAAYDFLLLRNAAGEDLAELSEWWTRFQESDEAQRDLMRRPREGRTTRRRRGRRRRPAAGQGG